MDIDAILRPMQYVVTICSLPIGLYSLISASERARKDRELRTFVEIQKFFTEQWTASWRLALSEAKKIKENGGDVSENPDIYFRIYDFLNWIDWIGHMAIVFSVRIEPCLESIRPQIKDVIDIYYDTILKDCRENGGQYWKGLMFISQRLKILGPNSLLDNTHS